MTSSSASGPVPTENFHTVTAGTFDLLDTSVVDRLRHAAAWRVLEATIFERHDRTRMRRELFRSRQECKFGSNSMALACGSSTSTTMRLTSNMSAKATSRERCPASCQSNWRWLLSHGIDGLNLRGDVHMEGLRRLLESQRMPFVNVGVDQPEKPYASRRAACGGRCRSVLSRCRTTGTTKCTAGSTTRGGQRAHCLRRRSARRLSSAATTCWATACCSRWNATTCMPRDIPRDGL